MASDTDVTLPPFRVTRAAIDEITALGGHLRLDVESGGCCGATYVYSVPTGAGTDPATLDAADEVFGCPGAWLVVGSDAMAVLPGATLDYTGTAKPPRFRVVRNPNTQDVCACRRSFGSPWPGPKQPDCRAYAPMPWNEDDNPSAHWDR